MISGLPERITLARQMTKKLKGKHIERVVAGKSTQRFAFFCGDPLSCDAMLRGGAGGSIYYCPVCQKL